MAYNLLGLIPFKNFFSLKEYQLSMIVMEQLVRSRRVNTKSAKVIVF